MFIPVSEPSILTRFIRLFIPVEEGYVQHIYVIDKKEDGTVTRSKEYGVQYVREAGYRNLSLIFQTRTNTSIHRP